ncbi:hypothetical protein SB780_40850, partial [Burkholderia sp. SIMBA_057]
MTQGQTRADPITDIQAVRAARTDTIRLARRRPLLAHDGPRVPPGVHVMNAANPQAGTPPKPESTPKKGIPIGLIAG